MSNYQRFNSKEPSTKTEEYLHDPCDACGGQGWYYPESGIPLHSIPCPKCKGTGLGSTNKSTIGKIVLIALILIGAGCVICKLLNI